jgi:hypothetical protein
MPSKQLNHGAKRAFNSGVWKEFGLTLTARENLGIDTRPKKLNPFSLI